MRGVYVLWYILDTLVLGLAVAVAVATILAGLN